MRTTVKSHLRRGFTLVELLVVIAIIAVLIAMLLPALRRVREQAVLTQCMSNLRQMGLMLHTYASDQGDYPYYNYPGAPAPAERIDAGYNPGDSFSRAWNPWWAGQVTRHEFLPMLVRQRYLGTAEVGFCPVAWEQRNFNYVKDPSRPYDPLVMENGLGGWQIAYAGYPMWSRGDFVDVGHQNAGEYLYLGPGTNGTWWNWESVSARLAIEYGNDGTSNQPDRINRWTGIYANGRVTRFSDTPYPGRTISTVWSRKRVPIMGEAAQTLANSDWTQLSLPNAAPHMPRWRARSQWSISGGNLNYLFNDGSVITYPYRR